MTLQAYTVQPMKVLRELHVNVNYGDYERIQKLFVIEGSGPKLMGSRLPALYTVGLAEFGSCHSQGELQGRGIRMMTKYNDIFLWNNV